MRPSYQAVGAFRAAVGSYAAARPLIVAVAVPRAVSHLPRAHSQPSPRLFSSTPFTSATSSTSSSSSSSSSTPESPASKGPIRDEAIIPLSSYVRLVDPKTGSLAGPFNTRQILSKLDRTRFFLQQVAPAQPDRATVEYDPSCPPSNVDPSSLIQYAICKLIDKKEEFDRLRNLKRRSQDPTAPQQTSANASSSKEVQLTWSVGANDLAHKLGKAKKEMLKGARINVVISTKPGGRKYIKGLNPEVDQQREKLLDHIDEFLCTDQSSKREPVEEGEQTDKEVRIARRLGEIDWQRGGSAAVMSFECFRNK